MLKKLLLNLFMLLVIVHLKDGSVLKYKDADGVYTFKERVEIVKTIPTAIPNVFTEKIVAVFNIDEIRYVEAIQ